MGEPGWPIVTLLCGLFVIFCCWPFLSNFLLIPLPFLGISLGNPPILWMVFLVFCNHLIPLLFDSVNSVGSLLAFRCHLKTHRFQWLLLTSATVDPSIWWRLQFFNGDKLYWCDVEHHLGRILAQQKVIILYCMRRCMRVRMYPLSMWIYKTSVQVTWFQYSYIFTPDVPAPFQGRVADLVRSTRRQQPELQHWHRWLLAPRIPHIPRGDTNKYKWQY